MEAHVNEKIVLQLPIFIKARIEVTSRSEEAAVDQRVLNLEIILRSNHLTQAIRTKVSPKCKAKKNDFI